MYEILTQVSTTYKALWDVPVRRDDHTQLMFYHLTHTLTSEQSNGDKCHEANKAG